MDFKGIALYLAFSFLLVFVLTFVGLGEGLITFQNPNLFQYLVLVSLMVIPSACGGVVSLLRPSSAIATPWRIWPIPVRKAMRVVVLPLLVFSMAYALATLAGLTYPQWNLGSLLNDLEATSVVPLSPATRAIAPAVILSVYPIVSLVIGATFFALLALGSEFGWRGYLLPRLMPLGFFPATAITGVCWGLWFFPLVYGWHKEHGEFTGMAGAQLRIVAMAVVLSFVLAHIQRRANHMGLCALALGSFAGQACGIWEYLFQHSTSPWTGPLGWVMIGTWGVSACFSSLWGGRDTGCGDDAVSSDLPDSA